MVVQRTLQVTATTPLHPLPPDQEPLQQLTTSSTSPLDPIPVDLFAPPLLHVVYTGEELSRSSSANCTRELNLSPLRSIRPSFGALPLDGVLPQDGTMDTAGLFARSPSIFSSVSRVWYSEQPSLPAGPWDALPSTLTVLSDYAADEKATMVIEEWLEIVSKGLGMERKTVNVSETWDKFAGVKAGIAEYTVNVSITPFASMIERKD